MAHLEPARLVEHLRGTPLGDADREHLDGCGRCGRALAGVRTLLAGVAEIAHAAETEAADEPVPPASDALAARLADRAALSEEGLALAGELLAAARSGRAEEALRGMRTHPARGYALLYAAQQGARLALTDPHEAFRLALLVRAESTIPSTEPVRESVVAAEALLLESQALLNQGIVPMAVQRARDAREAFRSAGHDAFADALCAYFEASALAYGAEYGAAEKLLKRATKVFAEFGQPHWMGRALLALGTALSQRGDNHRALEYLRDGVRHLDPAEDATALAAALVNTASVLAHLGRHAEARTTYARALRTAHEHGLESVTRHVKLGLAEIDFLAGELPKALDEYERLAAEARARGDAEQLRFTLLYVAECRSRLGRGDAAHAALRELRRELQEHPFQSVALEDLFACLDRGDVDAGMIASVRARLEEAERPPIRARRAG